MKLDLYSKGMVYCKKTFSTIQVKLVGNKLFSNNKKTWIGLQKT